MHYQFNIYIVTYLLAWSILFHSSQFLQVVCDVLFCAQYVSYNIAAASLLMEETRVPEKTTDLPQVTDKL